MYFCGSPNQGFETCEPWSTFHKPLGHREKHHVSTHRILPDSVCLASLVQVPALARLGSRVKGEHALAICVVDLPKRDAHFCPAAFPDQTPPQPLQQSPQEFSQWIAVPLPFQQPYSSSEVHPDHATPNRTLSQRRSSATLIHTLLTRSAKQRRKRGGRFFQ